MTVMNPVFWPPKNNCVRCEELFNPEKGGIKQADYLFICPKCAPAIIPLLVHDFSVFGSPYMAPFPGAGLHKLQLIADAGALAQKILDARKSVVDEN